jgi:hypothetical protein
MTVKKTTNPADVCTPQDAIDDWGVRFFDFMEKVEEHYGNKAPLDCAAVPMSVASQYLDAHNKAYILDAGLDLSTIATLADLSREYQNALIIELEEKPQTTAEEAERLWEEMFSRFILNLKQHGITRPYSEINAIWALLRMSRDEQGVFRCAADRADLSEVRTLADLREVYKDYVIEIGPDEDEDDDLKDDDFEDDEDEDLEDDDDD